MCYDGWGGRWPHTPPVERAERRRCVFRRLGTARALLAGMLACLLCAECGAGASCSVNTAPLVVGVQTDVPGQPFGIAVTPDSGWLLATMDGVRTRIAVVRVTSTGLQPLRTLLLPEAAAPTGVGLTNSGNVLMVAEYGAGALLLVSVPLLEAGHGHPVLDQIKTGFGAIEAVATPGGGYAFVSNERNASISVVDLRTRQLVGNIPVPSTPVGLALSPNGEYLYGTSEQGFLSVINVRTAETDPASAVVGLAPAGHQPVRVAVAPDGKTVWVTARADNHLVACSAAKLLSDPGQALLATVTVGTAPVGLALLDGGALAVVANSDRFQGAGQAQSFTVVNTADALAGKPAVTGTFPAGSFPREVVVAPGGKTVYISDYDSGTLLSIPAGRLPTRSLPTPAAGSDAGQRGMPPLVLWRPTNGQQHGRTPCTPGPTAQPAVGGVAPRIGPGPRTVRELGGPRIPWPRWTGCPRRMCGDDPRRRRSVHRTHRVCAALAQIKQLHVCAGPTEHPPLSWRALS